MTPIQVRHSYDRSKRAGTKRILYRNRVFSLSHQMAQDATFLYALQSSSAGHGSGQTIFLSREMFYQQVAGRISKRNYIPLVGPCAKFQKTLSVGYLNKEGNLCTAWTKQRRIKKCNAVTLKMAKEGGINSELRVFLQNTFKISSLVDLVNVDLCGNISVATNADADVEDNQTYSPSRGRQECSLFVLEVANKLHLTQFAPPRIFVKRK